MKARLKYTVSRITLPPAERAAGANFNSKKTLIIRLSSAGNRSISDIGFPDLTKGITWYYDQNNLEQTYIAPDNGWLSYTISVVGLGGQFIKVNGQYIISGAQISSHQEGAYDFSGLIPLKKGDEIIVKCWYATNYYGSSDYARTNYDRLVFYPFKK